VAGGNIEHYRSTDGLSGDGVTALYEDSEANLWVATAGGLDRFRDLKVISYSTREGLSADQVNAVVGRRDGSVWLSNSHSLDVIRDGVVSSIRAGSGLPGSEVGAIFEDHTGTLWAGIDDALFIYDGKQFTKIMAGNPKNDDIRSITEDKSGMVWAMNDAARLFGFRNGKVVKQLTNSPDNFADAPLITPDAKEGVWLLAKNQDFLHVTDSGITRIRFHRAPNAANVYSLTTADDGSVLGGSAIGVAAVRGDRAQTLGVNNGLPCPHVWSLIQDPDSSLWLYTECGLLVLDKQEWAKWWANPTASVQLKVIDSLEGAQGANTFFTNTSSRSSDGRLWFANSRVAQAIDPSLLKTMPKFAPVKIERVAADQNTFLSGSPVHLPPRPKSLQIDYTAPSFSLASKIQFRYRLVGHDESWVDAGTRRQAFYTDLPPGHYEFEVIASNSLGDWGSRAARIDLDVAPTFYQTRWFLAACIVALGVIVWLLYLVRIRQLSARIQLRMEAQLRERERIARDLHDTLLQGVQGLMYTFHAGIERIAKSEPTLTMLREALVRADAFMGEARAHVSGLRRSSVFPETLEDRLAALVSGLTPGVSAKIAMTTVGMSRPIRRFVMEQTVRIVGEALHNAVTHAGANSIAIETHFNESELSVRVRDDGRGFDVDQSKQGPTDGHFGLIGMYERADRMGAQMTIVSREFEGTQVILQIPQGRAYEAEQKGFRARILRLWHPPTDAD
jgi:signal transduction histidine kinase